MKERESIQQMVLDQLNIYRQLKKKKATKPHTLSKIKSSGSWITNWNVKHETIKLPPLPPSPTQTTTTTTTKSSGTKTRQRVLRLNTKIMIHKKEKFVNFPGWDPESSLFLGLYNPSEAESEYIPCIMTSSLGYILLDHTFNFSPLDISRGHLTSIFLFYYTAPKLHYKRFQFSQPIDCLAQGMCWTDSWFWVSCRAKLSASIRGSYKIPRN